MFKNVSALLTLFVLVSCGNNSMVKSGAGAISGIDPSDICEGKVVKGVIGTANCTGGGGPSSVTEGFYILSSRIDNAALDFIGLVDDLWAGGSPFATRSIATLKEAQNGSLLYVNNYSVIPDPLEESDGRHSSNSPADVTDPLIKRNIPEKRHYLETIVASKMESDTPGSFTSRQNAIKVCGTSGKIEERIADCRFENGVWSFYSGAQYGQVGEGDWSLVSVVNDSGKKYEVWRDERTKFIWSDSTSSEYNWFQASGYSKPQDVSFEETNLRSDPGRGRNYDGTGSIMQPLSGPISVCPDVVDGKIAAGGGTSGYTYVNPETAFKGGLNISHGVIWRLPSVDDYKLADVNGIRKVLPNIADNYFYTSTSHSDVRVQVWLFGGYDGFLDYYYRYQSRKIRCVGVVGD